MAVDFIPIDRDTPYILRPSVQDYVAQDRLARFVVESLVNMSRTAPAQDLDPTAF